MKSETYARTCIHYYSDFVPALLRDALLRSRGSGAMADLGCGDGALLFALKQQGYIDRYQTVYAVDLSDIRLKQVQGIDSRIRCIAQDACDIPEIPAGCLDFIISNQVIEHVEHDDVMINSIKRLLKPDGTLYLTTVFKKWYGWYFYRTKQGKWAIDPTHVREYTRDEQLTSTLRKAGFSIFRNKKTLQWFAITDFLLKRMGFKQDVYQMNIFFRTLRKIKIPIPGYYNWELVCSADAKVNKRLIMITNAHAYEQGLSGGERIAIELYRRHPANLNVTVYTSNFGASTWTQCGIETARDCVIVSRLVKDQKRLLSYCSLSVSYMKRIFDICWRRSFWHDALTADYVYSCSDFWPDSLPAFFAKMVNPRICWIAGFYLKAPAPWHKDSPYKGAKWIIGLLYWLTQLPLYALIKAFADKVFVTSQPDVARFVSNKRSADNVVVVQGGVDIAASDLYLESGAVIPVDQRVYDACFIGRFHYQKGVLELIDIWKQVCENKPDAKLCMIGMGTLDGEVKSKIKAYKLDKNITLAGFIDGNDKFEVFKRSKIVVHPATYDSGGMAAAEALAWGLPGVAFDLESLRTYYPKGMLKTPCFDVRLFADAILRLLSETDLYTRLRDDGISLVREQWAWDNQAKRIYNSFLS